MTKSSRTSAEPPRQLDAERAILHFMDLISIGIALAAFVVFYFLIDGLDRV